MGRSEPPFIYDPPSRRAPSVPEAPFNPKQYEQASWAASPQKPKKNGPLVNFNQHPDSVCPLQRDLGAPILTAVGNSSG